MWLTEIVVLSLAGIMSSTSADKAGVAVLKGYTVSLSPKKFDPYSNVSMLRFPVVVGWVPPSGLPRQSDGDVVVGRGILGVMQEFNPSMENRLKPDVAAHQCLLICHCEKLH